MSTEPTCAELANRYLPIIYLAFTML